LNASLSYLSVYNGAARLQVGFPRTYWTGRAPRFYAAFSDETGASAFQRRSFGAATGTVLRSRHSVPQSPRAIFERRGVSPSRRVEAEGRRRTSRPPVLAHPSSHLKAASQIVI